jgi:hypothetical protein
MGITRQQVRPDQALTPTDMKMTIDATPSSTRGRNGFGIMSSDSGSMPLAMRIRQDGVLVYGFCAARATPEASAVLRPLALHRRECVEWLVRKSTAGQADSACDRR